ncbi:hypothetical protein [Thiosocius teredinicola]|uniref:hypothetical protein n=1 Tax=Thiosocius teredinicola TaxID=1973002 RepID=UPI000F78EC57
MSLPMAKVMENWDKRFETEELDEFRDLVSIMLRRQERSIEKEEESLKHAAPDHDFDAQMYRSHLEDRWAFAREVQHLSDELAIVALYKQVELHTKRVAKKHFPKIDPKKLSSIDDQIKLLPFKLKKLHAFAAFDELRLLNNSIKHEGKVSKSLSRAFSSWKEGKKLKGLGDAYQRLRPLVEEYVQAYVGACYAKSAAKKP